MLTFFIVSFTFLLTNSVVFEEPTTFNPTVQPTSVPTCTCIPENPQCIITPISLNSPEWESHSSQHSDPVIVDDGSSCVVHLEGLVKYTSSNNGVIPAYSTIGWLPPQYSPSQVKVFSARTEEPVGTVRINVETNGVIRTIQTNAQDWVSLDGITFRV